MAPVPEVELLDINNVSALDPRMCSLRNSLVDVVNRLSPVLNLSTVDKLGLCELVDARIYCKICHFIYHPVRIPLGACREEAKNNFLELLSIRM